MKDSGLSFREACKEVFASMNINSFGKRGEKLRKATSRMLNRRSVDKRRGQARGRRKKKLPPKRRNQTTAVPLPPPSLPEKIEPFVETKKIALAEAMGQKRLF